MFRFIRELFGTREKEPASVPHVPISVITTAAPVKPAEFQKAVLLAPPAFFTRNFRFVALDVETANSSRHSICQIGLAAVCDQGRIECATFLVDPDERFDQFNVNLHGIDAAKVAGHPRFPEIMSMIREFLERHVIVQHSNFDQLAFAAACDRNRLPHLSSSWRDSVGIARRAWPELKGNGGHGLGNLKNVLKLDFEHHDAGEDARAAAQVVLLAEAQTRLNFDEITSTRRKARVFPQPVVMPGNADGPLFGKAVCFTGKLSMDRAEAASLAAASGMEVKNSVSRKLSFLVVGDQDLTLLNGHDKSTKHRRAEGLIEEGASLLIIGETEFLKLIRE